MTLPPGRARPRADADSTNQHDGADEFAESGEWDSRRALQRGSGRPGRIVNMHEAVDALALSDNRNLLLPHLITPGAGLAHESVPFISSASPGVEASARTYLELEARASATPGIEFVALRYGFFYGPGTWYTREGDMGDTRIRNFAAGSGARPNREAPQAG